MNRDLKLISVSLLIWGAGEGLFLFFQPLYLQQLGANTVQIGAILGLIGFSMGIAQIPAGWLSDRIGAKFILRLAWVVGTIATALMAFAENLPVFVTGMILYGLTAAVIAPMNSYIASVRGDLTIGRAITIAIGGYNLGAMVGPLTGGIVSQFLGLRSAYWLATILFVISTIAVFFLNENDRDIIQGPQDKFTAFLSANPNFVKYLIIVFLVIFSTYLPIPLTPNYLQCSRSVPYSLLGFLGGLASLGYVLLAIICGHLKPEKGLIIGQMLMILFSILIFAGSGMIFFSLAYLCASGYRFCRSMVVAYSRNLVKVKNIGLAFGIVETVCASAFTLAPIIAGVFSIHNSATVYLPSIFIASVILLFSILFLNQISKEIVHKH